MPDSDKILEILIQFKEEKIGADQAVADLGRIKGAAADTADATKESAKSSERGGEAAAEAGKKGAKGAEESTFKHRELREAINAAARAFPFLGEIGHAELNPLEGVVLGLVTAFTLWGDRIKNASVALGGVELPDVDPDFGKKLDDQADSWTRLADAVGKVANAYDSIQESADRAQKKIQLLADSQKKQLDAQREVDLAKVGASGESKAQQDLERAEINRRYRDAGLNVDAQTDAQIIALKKKEEQDLKDKSARDTARAAGIHIASKEDDDATEAELKKNADAARQTIAESQKRSEVIGRRSDELQRGPADVVKNLPEEAADYAKFVSTYGTDATPAEAEAIEVSGRRAQQTAIDRYQAFLKRKKGRARQQKERDDATADAQKEAEDAEKLGLEIPDDEDNDAIKQKSAAEVNRLKNTQDAESSFSAVTGELPPAAAAIQFQQAGGQINAGQQKMLASLQAFFQTLGYSHDQMIDLISHSTDTVQSHAAAIQQLRSRLDAVEKFNSNGR